MTKSFLCSSHRFSIEEKIKQAHDLYVHYAHRLLGNAQVAGLLHELSNSIDATNLAMRAAGIIEQCTACEEEGGGSCCGAGIENNYDAVLLLTNLLLGVFLPEERYDKRSCYFLGKHGCLLRSRHVLCVNYICGKIEHALAPDKIIRVQHIAGNELDCSFILHESIKALLNSDLRTRSLPKQDTLPSRQLL